MSNQKLTVMKKLIILLILILAVTFVQRATAQETIKEELHKAQNLVKQGQGAEASAILVKIMQNQPDNKEAVQWLLIANMKRSPTGEMDAVVQLDSLGHIYQNNTGILFFKTFILAEYGRNEEALAGFENLIKLQPDSAVNWIGKGQVLSTLKRHQEALLAFEKATSLDKPH